MKHRAPYATSALALLGALVLSACGDETGSPVEPSFSVAAAGACDLAGARTLAETYFTGNATPNIREGALDLIDLMTDDCLADDANAYVGHWVRFAGILEIGLETGQTGTPSDGNRILQATLAATLPSGGDAFDPCAGAAQCVSWDGYPTLPDFTAALSPGGAWAVPTGTTPVCSGFRTPCGTIDPALDGDVWGVEPSDTWENALHQRPSVIWGAPITAPSPTGEQLLQTAVPAYTWNVIPHPQTFAPNASPPAVLEVGLCSTAQASSDETLVQKSGTSVLEEATLSFCPIQTTAAPAARTHWFATLLQALDPRPRPLRAVAFLRGPGGTAGGFSDFWAIDSPDDATVTVPSTPADGGTGVTLTDALGNPVKVVALSVPAGTPTERAVITIRFFKNNGLVPSGNTVTVDPAATTNLTCGANGVCTGMAQADQEPEPGTLEIPVRISKPGAYRMCVTATRAPYDFGEQVCTEKFNIRPNG